jgi:hypothetical protein
MNKLAFELGQKIALNNLTRDMTDLPGLEPVSYKDYKNHINYLLKERSEELKHDPSRYQGPEYDIQGHKVIAQTGFGDFITHHPEKGLFFYNHETGRLHKLKY